ncbi:MAG: lauroyl acyltransferase [Pseudohongiella nitratireducens]|nr:lauroyl acyltransferase [Pseudohongiella nitratireducens]MDF1623975.1 lauroyl acyltransferase [Pseudohongiella nitratireducens]
MNTVKSWLIKSFLKLLSLLPLAAVHKMASAIGELLNVLPIATRKVTETNLQRAMPELDEITRKELAKSSLCETIKAGLELGHMWYASLESVTGRIRTVHGFELVENAKASGKGIIYAAPHLGSWELLGIYLSTLGPMTTLYKPAKIDGLNELIAHSRAKGGAKLVPTNRQGVVKLTKALKQGESTGILPDQQPKRDGGVFADFFGVPAFTMTLLPKLAARTGAVVLLAYAERLPGNQGFDVHFREADPDVYSENSEVAAAGLNRSVEACVRQIPAQYQWEYKRFRKRPDSEAPEGKSQPFYQ